MSTVIRRASAEDAGQILEFIRALAAFERAPDAVEATEDGLIRDGFGPHPFFKCLIADYDGQPAGFALYFFNYSTWVGRPGIYVEDLFVLPEFLDEWGDVALGSEAIARLATCGGADGGPVPQLL